MKMTSLITLFVLLGSVSVHAEWIRPEAQSGSQIIDDRPYQPELITETYLNRLPISSACTQPQPRNEEKSELIARTKSDLSEYMKRMKLDQAQSASDLKGVYNFSVYLVMLAIEKFTDVKTIEQQIQKFEDLRARYGHSQVVVSRSNGGMSAFYREFVYPFYAVAANEVKKLETQADADESDLDKFNSTLKSWVQAFPHLRVDLAALNESGKEHFKSLQYGFEYGRCQMIKARTLSRQIKERRLSNEG